MLRFKPTRRVRTRSWRLRGAPALVLGICAALAAGGLQRTADTGVGRCESTAATGVGRHISWPPAPPLVVEPEQDPGPLPPSVRAETLRPGWWRCTFRFRPSEPARSVTLAGTFNGWNRAATPLTGPDEQGFWSATVDLPSGRHLYKFVLDDQRWEPDPRNPEGEDDGHGGQNSVLRLGRMASLKVSPARLGDGVIEGGALEHIPDRPRYFQPLAADRVLVRYRTLAHDVAKVWLAIQDHDLLEMRLIDEDRLYALWETQATLPDGGRDAHRSPPDGGRDARRSPPDGNDADPEPRRLRYTFVLADGDLRVSDPNIYSRSFTPESVFYTPEWAKHAVWYQIFPDRFRNGNPANDPEPVRPWTSEWFTPSPWEADSGKDFYEYVFSRFYGGDLDGIEEKLPYLRELGVNAIYLNPIFKAPSLHKYDAISYIHVDDHFGTKGDYEAVAATEDLLDPSTWKWTESDRRFLRFLKAARAQGFRVIIDGVFNHVGDRHPAFLDVKKHGRSSRYADWFNVTSWEPFRYTGWGGFGQLPEFKKSPTGLASESLKQHIFAVTRRWMDPDGDGDPSDGIDGWRLDVPNEIPAPFWAEWRALVKSINPDAYIVGEIWDQADTWLDGRHFDAVMNYPFARAVVAWVMDQDWKIPVSEFDRRLRELRLAYPLPATLVLQNLLGSHDTDRLASMAINPDRAYDHANRVQDTGPHYDNSKPPPEAYRKARLAALVQMTYVGAPMIYYGDEVGMWGADDPTCRKPMLWKDLEPYERPEENYVMEDHLEFYRRVIALRNAHPALRTGSFHTLLTDDEADVWVFLRADDDEQLIVALNASTQTRHVLVTLPPDAPRTWVGVFGTPDVASDLRVRRDDRLERPNRDREEAVITEAENLELTVPSLGGVVLRASTAR